MIYYIGYNDCIQHTILSFVKTLVIICLKNQKNKRRIYNTQMLQEIRLFKTRKTCSCLFYLVVELFCNNGEVNIVNIPNAGHSYLQIVTSKKKYKRSDFILILSE